MARITLKLPKAVTPAAAPKSPTSRARRAQQEGGRHRVAAATPTPPPKAPTAPAALKASTAPPSKPHVATPPPRSKPSKPYAATSTPRSKPSKPYAATSTPPSKPSKPYAATPAQRPPRPATPPSPAHENPDDPRLSKRMGELGLCSRREADEWIANGWVKVDGVVVNTLGVRVPRDARIEIDPEAARHQGEQVTILLNKPVGYVSGQPEDGHQPAMVLIKPENRWSEDPSPIKFRHGHLLGLAPAGRLDIDSTGLLVFTQDGRVAKRLIGSDSDVEKEYLVRVEGTLSEEGLELLRHGLELDGVRLKPARVSWANEDQLRIVLREGRKRQIRRMCEAVGLVVTGLKRVRSGGVPLGPLPVGQWRYLRRDEKF
jgi:23S rRNA pseudouridine2604 synthase